MAKIAVFLHGWLPRRAEVQVTCNLMFTHEDNSYYSKYYNTENFERKAEKTVLVASLD